MWGRLHAGLCRTRPPGCGGFPACADGHSQLAFLVGGPWERRAPRCWDREHSWAGLAMALVLTRSPDTGHGKPQTEAGSMVSAEPSMWMQPVGFSGT